MAVQRTLQEMPKTAGLTPEQVRRQMEMADALLRPGQGGGRPITNWAEGLNALAEGFMGGQKRRRAESAEAEGMQQRSQAFSQLLDSYGSTPSYGAGGGGGFGMAALPASSGGPSASITQGDMASYVRNGLVQRGLPGHVADAFVVNMQDESGLNAGINEANPIVPGSRGGFGLYQLTGPRRRQYEAFAAQRGVSAADPDAQLDFLMTELQGSEANAARSILSAPDTATAAQAIVNDFLRPAPEHRASRARRYAGLPTSAPAQMAYAPDPMSATPAPANAGVQVASLDPSAGYESALGQGAMRATGQPSGGGAYTLPDSELDPESRARMEAMRTPFDSSNVRPYSGPGAIAETSGYVYDGQGFRHNGVQELPDIGQPQAMQSQPQPYQISQAPAPYQPPIPNNQALAQALMSGGQPSAPTGNRQAELARALLGNPWTQDIGEQLAMQAMSQGPQERWETIQGPDGSIWQRNSADGRLQQVQGAPEQANPYMRAGDALYNTQTGEWVREPQGRQDLINAGEGRLYDPNTQQWIVAPQSGQQGFRQATPEEAAGYGSQAGQFGPDGRFYPNNPPSGMSIESDGQGGFRVIQGVGAGSAKPFTEGQSKDNVFSTRARGALPTLNEHAARLTSRGDQILENVPFGFGRDFQDTDYQIARTAGDEFLQAILRKDTGAAITEQEQALYGATYLPRPGDSPEVQAYKAQARERAIAAIEAGMSPAQMVAQERALQASQIPTGSPENPVQLDEVTVPSGISPEEWEFMTPEERRLFQ